MLEKNIFGLLAFLHWNHDWNAWHFPDELLEKAIRQLKDLGVPMIRTDILWSDVDRGRGRCDFSRYDALINRLRSANIQVLALLNYNRVKDGPAGEVLWNKPPESFDDFSSYVSQAVRHFKDRISYWEIWNEPNHPEYWDAPQDGLKSYIDLLRRSYRAAKAENPACTVLNGGLTMDIVGDTEQFYANGGGSFTDILSIHPFVDPHAPDARKRFQTTLRGVQSVMSRFGDINKPIWITEMGCPGVPATSGTKKWFAGDNISEKEQAEWLEKIYDWVKEFPKVEKLFWAFYRDTDEMFHSGMFKDGTDHLGLVRFDLQPKPSFERFQALIKSGSKSVPVTTETAKKD